MIILVTTEYCLAQSFYFRHYQVEQGLSNNTVFCTSQDKKGFFWLGTKDGLNRFDGYRFKVFRNEPDDPHSIGDNFIRSLLVDDADNLYVGTRNGLYSYNAGTERFTLLYKSGDEIRDIKKDSSGLIWFVAGQTLISLYEKTNKIRVYNPADYFFATSVCIDPSGKVWAATANGTLQLYSKSTDSFKSFDIFNPDQSRPRWIEKIYAGKPPYIFAGTSNYGIKLFNTIDNSSRDILTYNADKTEIFARDFIQYTDTEVWVATESGIYIYDMQKQSFTNLKKQYNNPYAISDNAVYSLCRDKEGGIWAGTYFGGVNYYSKHYASFQKYLPGNGPLSLSGNAVREICEDKYGNLWIGTEDAGLNKLDRKTGFFTYYKPTGISEGISYTNIHGLLASGDELWVGTFEHGLNVLDIRSGKVIRFYNRGKDADLLRSNFIVTICQTKKGHLYIGTRQGLYFFNLKENDFVNIPGVASTSFIHTLLEDKDGILWIGTMGNGLFYYDADSKRWGHFYHKPESKTGIASNFITTLFEDSRNSLWIGTEGGGLSRFTPGDSSFINHSSKDGFPSNTVFKLLEDENSNLWVTTSKGLVRFNPVSGKVNVYSTANGLLTDQFNYNSGYKDADGTMYFGSFKGMISFKPETIVEDKFIPPVYITAVTVNNKELKVDDASPLKESALFVRRIDLSHRQSSFAIDFAALSFTSPELTAYKYIMEGLDAEWTLLKTNRRVYFTNLSPGTYVFKVRAAGSNGQWSDNTTELTISIHPSFWAGTTAYFLYTLLAAAIIFFLVRTYHLRVKEKSRRRIELIEHEKEKEIYQAKIDFFTNVAHEIKTPLTLIKVPMEQIAKKAGDKSPFQYDIKVMERNTDRLIELTNQLLDFRKVEAQAFGMSFTPVNVSELLLEKHNSFKLLAEQKNINFTLTLPDKPVTVCADMDSLQKILNNLFYNALSYGKNTAKVELIAPRDDDGMLKIEFSNDGHLIPAEMKEKIFEPFFRLKEAQNKSGTGIGLALSRTLVSLHKGRLYLTDSQNGMNIFVLELPVEQLHNSESS